MKTRVSAMCSKTSKEKGTTEKPQKPLLNVFESAGARKEKKTIRENWEYIFGIYVVSKSKQGRKG